MKVSALALVAVVCAVAISCSKSVSSSSATPADAKAFLDTANETTLRLGIQQSQAGWVQQTYITDDTEALAAHANQIANDAGARFAKDATKYDKLDVPADQRRQLTLLETSLPLAAP